MKFIHISDLHIGKKLNEFSLAEDQRHILGEILKITESEKPDCVFIAGDIYDKSVPSGDAVEIFDAFLYKLALLNTNIFIISGNHDSPERLSFGARLMQNSRVFIAPVYDGKVYKHTLKDNFGPVNIYLLPFVSPRQVRRFFDEEIVSYNDAVKTAISEIPKDETERNIILTHQFVTGALQSDSEDISVGGTDNIDVSLFDKFDYVALGHIHRPQSIKRDTVRYCGTPLKYSFSEISQQKSVTLGEIREKGNIVLSYIPLTPLHDMREIRGTYEEVTDKRNYGNLPTDDYIHITLTDEFDVPDALFKLRTIYPNLMKLDYDNKRTQSSGELTLDDTVERRSPLQIFCDFYKQRMGDDMNDTQRNFCEKIMTEIWEDEK